MKWTYQAEFIRCGKGCSGCPHGPYWYGYRHEGGKMRKKYFGKKDPREPEPQPRRHEAEQSSFDGIFNRRTASTAIALAILRFDPRDATPCAYEIALKRYRFLAAVAHPDKGGSTIEFQRIQAAWSYLKAVWYHGYK